MATYTPVIINAIISPNPSVVGQKVMISIAATDVEAIPSAIDVRSGEFQSGEV